MKTIKHEDIYHAHDFGIADTRTHDAVDSIKSPSDKENLEVRNEDNDISNPNTDICDESSDEEEYRMSDEELKEFLLIGITKDVFSQIVCLTCNVPVFMEQPLGTQKEIIEKILGVDIISKKVVALKSLITETKNIVNNKQFEYDTLVNQKKTLEESIEHQLSELKKNKEIYELNKKNKITDLVNKINEIKEIDFDKEEENLKKLAEYEVALNETEANLIRLTKLENDKKDIEKKIKNDISKLEELQKIDFNSELNVIFHYEDGSWVFSIPGFSGTTAEIVEKYNFKDL